MTERFDRYIYQSIDDAGNLGPVMSGDIEIATRFVPLNDRRRQVLQVEFKANTDQSTSPKIGRHPDASVQDQYVLYERLANGEWRANFYPVELACQWLCTPGAYDLHLDVQRIVSSLRPLQWRLIGFAPWEAVAEEKQADSSFRWPTVTESLAAVVGAACAVAYFTSKLSCRLFDDLSESS